MYSINLEYITNELIEKLTLNTLTITSYKIGTQKQNFKLNI